MDDPEFLTPLDTRREREYKSTTTLESSTNLSSVSFRNPDSTASKESLTEEDAQFGRGGRDFHVPSGFSSVLFAPIVEALFRPANLKKELLVSINLRELARALITAAASVENAFSVVGNYAKGLCLLLSHKLRHLSSDFGAYSKALVGSDLAVPARAELSRYYESDDEGEHVKRRSRKRKIKDTESVSTIQDYADKYQSELVPIERLEMLRVMNLGLAGNDLFFTSNELSPVLRDYLSEMNVSSKASGDKDWLSFDDLRMLSSPFKLNAYSFTPNFDETTVAASSELSFSTSYDLDWSLRNDPLNYSSSYYEKYFGADLRDDAPPALEDAGGRRRRKSATLRLCDVDLVRAEIKYDRRPNRYKPKRRQVAQRRPSLPDNRPERAQAPQHMDAGQKTLDQMFDRYFTSVVEGASAPNANAPVLPPALPAAAGAADAALGAAGRELQMDMPPLLPQARAKGAQANPSGSANAAQMGGKRLVGEQGAEEAAFQEATDGLGTLDVLNWLREAFRKTDLSSVSFGQLTSGLKAGRASVVFLRVLILASSNFVSIAREKEAISIAPAVGSVALVRSAISRRPGPAGGVSASGAAFGRDPGGGETPYGYV